MPGWLPSCLKPSPEKDESYKREVNKRNGSSECSEAGRSSRSSLAEERKVSTQVRLEKKSGSGYGLTISGGVDKDGSPRVSKLRAGGIAQRSDLLQVGDFIIAVNAIKTSGLRHDEVINLLKNAGDVVTLAIEYEVPMMPEENGIQVMTKLIEVCLPKEGSSFGFTIRGGVHADASKMRPITVSEIRTGGPADRDGTMKIGDHVVSVDDVLLSKLGHQDALQVIKQADQEVVFVLEYDVSVMDAVTNANGPLLIEVAKTPGAHLGVNLSSTMRAAKPCIVIDSIKPASIADRCGALHIGDEIRAIDGSSTDSMTVAEAMQLLQSALEQIKLEILPVSQFTPKLSYPHTTVQSVSQTIARSSSRPSTPLGYGTISNYNTLPSHASLVHKANTLPGSRRGKKHNTSLSMSSSTNGLVSGTQVCHTETLDLTLHSANGDYGLMLEGGVFANDILGTPAVITFLEPGGVAQRSGVLNIGDRILTINGSYTEDLSLEDSHQMLRESGQRCLLQVEFDIAESVVPSSGTFNIKLPKTDSGLGITVSAPKNRKRSDPLLVSHIKKGSIAHRVGGIEPGDKLLAIDGILLDQCSVEDAAQILREADEIVRLRLKKDEAFSDEPDGAVTYSVELVRHGGPLGVTISGTEELFDPIIISGLTEGGLAGRTGAIHVGDRILAINGITLRGETLTSAIHLLKTAGDRVHLKISKQNRNNIDGLNGSEVSDDKFTYLKNGDHSNQDITHGTTLSALELWNRSSIDTGYHSNKKGRNFQMSPATRRSRRGKGSSRNRKDQRRTRSASRNQSNEYHQHYRSPISDDDWDDSRIQRTYGGSHERLRHLDQDDSSFDRSGVRRHFEHSKQTSDLVNEITASLNMVSNHLNFDGHYPSGNENGYGTSRSSTMPNSSRSTSFSLQDPLQMMHKTTAAELHKLVLYKDTDVEDFGFSVSDGVYENGVFVNMVRPGGPASRNGNIKTYDRILQINGTRTRDFDCCMVVPLIADSGNLLELLLSRNHKTPPANSVEKDWKDSSLSTTADVSKVSSLQTL